MWNQGSEDDIEEDVETLHSYIVLRQQLRNLNHVHRKSIEQIESKLEHWSCFKCQSRETPHFNSVERLVNEDNSEDTDQLVNPFQPIGVVSTAFPKKRGIPRQAAICNHSQGILLLYNSVFTNPEHAIDGLAEFSHMWILFYFHMNESSHLHAKVSPPRLNGIRTGVFATRSPHRPCPIGLSLVHIDRIEGSTIYFSGVDMLDGTPILDIKPYIPQYDDPRELGHLSLLALESTSVGVVGGPELGETREAPDGEEGDDDPPSNNMAYRPVLSPIHQVRVPAWVTVTTLALKVTFSALAETQLLELDGALKQTIADVLRQDPRSVYLRQRHSNQFYTFLIGHLHVSCRFDDTGGAVIVHRVADAAKVCECGQPEWQCSVHGQALEQ